MIRPLGTPSQVALVEATLARCTYPLGRLSAEVGVSWSDLSRYSARLAREAGGHDHGHDGEDVLEHVHVDGAHGVAVRHRVLGLFWLPPHTAVELDVSLEAEPELAAEVLLAELAHAVDYLDPAMTDEVRAAVWNAVHPPEQHVVVGSSIEDGQELGHGHSWFDVGEYRTWAGEEFMGLFCAAYSGVRPTIPFAHTWDADAAAQVRHALTPVVETPYFSTSLESSVFHDRHGGLEPRVGWASRDYAVAGGRRPCRTCRP